MKHARKGAVLAVGLSLLACGGAETEATMKQCYALVEGETKTTLVIEGAGNEATLTVHEWKDGVEVAPPETASGRLEADAFVYPDGTRLTFDANELAWPVDSLLSGAVFQAEPCS